MFSKNTKIAISFLIVAYLTNKYYINGKVPLTSPVVQTENGKIQGITAKSRNGRDFYSYKGIPYAKPPVGDLRFEPPQPLDTKWTGIRDASSFGSICLQVDLITRKVAGNEDCLSLNVYKPLLNGAESKKLPVLVFIHGGAFIGGSSQRYPAVYFMDEDVVLVTINYRLAALGFLNTGDGVVRGNMGLKDQVQALKYIQKNIAAFGGDPDNVTVFGNSAGGSSAHFHTISPLSKGLFHRAISQSGTAISHWATFRKPREQAQRFADLLNCPTQNSVEMVACLKKMNGLDLVEVHKEVLRPLRDWITLFVPTIESSPDSDSFLSADPYDLILSGQINNVPWMSGANKHEGLFFSAGVFRNESMVTRLRSDFKEVASKILDISPEKESAKLESLYKFYIKDSQQSELDKYTDLFSDRSFIFPCHKSAEAQSVYVPVYLYNYAYVRDASLANFIFALKGNYPALVELAVETISSWVKRNILGIQLPRHGVCHADELGMEFPVVWDSDITPEGKDYKMSVEMIKLWVAFARNEPLKIQDTIWKPVNPKALTYLTLDSISSQAKPAFQTRLDLWDSFKNIERIHD